MSCAALARTTVQAEPTASSKPSAVPNKAMINDSQRTVARTCARVMPIARSKPISRVRSWTDRANVLAMPSTAMTIANASSAYTRLSTLSISSVIACLYSA